MTPEEACDFVNRFISDAQLDGLDRFDFALRKIAKLPFWKSWRSQQIAEQALGIGPYWNSSMGEPPINRPDKDISPKTLFAYYRRLLRWKLFGGSR